MAKIFTLRITDSGCKLLIVKNEQIERWAEIPLEPGLVSGGVIQNEEKVAAILKEHLRSLNIDLKNVIVGINGLGSIYRIISLPEMAKPLLPEAVRREAERISPVPLEENYLSFQRLPKTGDEARIFLAIYPKPALEKAIKTLQKAGLEPYLVDLSPLALARTVNVPRAILVGVNSLNVDIVIMVDKVPQVIRSIRLPDEPGSIEKYSLMAEEIERTVAFYNSNQPQNIPDNQLPVMVCESPAASEENLRELSFKLGRVVTAIPSPLVSLADDFQPCQYMGNMGLALKEISRQKKFLDYSLINFNILPEELKVQHLKISRVLVPTALIGGLSIAIILAAMTLTLRPQIQSLKSEVASTQTISNQRQAEVAALNQKIQAINNELKPLEEHNQTLNGKIQQINANQTAFVKAMEAIIDQKPEEARLDGITYNGVNLVIVGSTSYSPSGSETVYRQVYDYARSLSSSGYFKSVLVSSIESSREKVTGPGSAGGIDYTGYRFNILVQ